MAETVRQRAAALDFARACIVNASIMPALPAHASSTLDPAEVDRFRRMADEWWDPMGKFRPLHKLGPVRLTYIRDQICRQFERDWRTPGCLDGLQLLDIGCGGGLICEPLSRLGGRVTGIDPAAENIEAAKRHAALTGLEVDYRAAMAEELVATGELFDAVLVLEVVEHVPDVAAFLKTCAHLVRPGGLMVVSTLNRTLKSFALAIVGAEYVLRWLPVGTHQWDRFIRPDELQRALRGAGLEPAGDRGMVYDPFADSWSLSEDTDVNYLMAATKTA